MNKKSTFLTFEGTDGVGKTTHIRLLEGWLKNQGFKVLRTREPGGGKIAEKIRRILLDPGTHIENMSELFLILVSRIEHLNKIVRPALQSDTIVLCDRFTDATIAYQGFGRGLSLNHIKHLNQIATNGLKPDLTILLDLPPKIGLSNARVRTKNKKGDRLEREGISFQKRVRKGYLALARKEPHRVHRILVQKRINQTQARIREVVKNHLNKFKGIKLK